MFYPPRAGHRAEAVAGVAEKRRCSRSGMSPVIRCGGGRIAGMTMAGEVMAAGGRDFSVALREFVETGEGIARDPLLLG